MRIVFMGSSLFACPSLELLVSAGPDEVVAVVLWLLSDDASYVTGENIRITGGI